MDTRVKPAYDVEIFSRVPWTQWVTEVVMSLKNSRIFCAAITACAALLPASALASQGPGGGMGTASNFTQAAMAVIVYGAALLIVGAGLIGALRRH